MIQAGDKVKILNEKAEGTVKKILSPKFALVQVGDFDYEYSIDLLIKTEQESTESIIEKIITEKIHPGIKKIIFEKEPAGASQKIKFKKGKKTPLVTEVDLHSSAIIGSTAGMTADQILDYQIKYFMRELDNAIAAREKQIIFIHGKGKGVLREEIHRILNSCNMVFYDAPFRFYGGGATHVEIH